MEQNSIDISLKYQLKGHKGAIYALAQGIDDSKIFSGGADRQIIEWDIHKGEGKLIAHSSATVMSILYLKEQSLLLVGQTEGGVHLIDLENRKELKLLKAHDSYIFDIVYLPQKQELVFSSADGSISVWSAKTFERLYHHRFAAKKLRKMDHHTSLGMLAISSGDEEVILLNINDYSEKARIKNNSGINIARFSLDGKQLICGDKDAHLHLLNINEEKILSSLPAHYWAIYDIQYSPDQQFFATASRDKTFKIWDPAEMKVLKRVEGRKVGGHTHSVNTLLWPLQEILITAGDDSDLRIWSVKSI